MNQIDIVTMGIMDTIFYIGCAFVGCTLYDYLKSKNKNNEQ